MAEDAGELRLDVEADTKGLGARLKKVIEAETADLKIRPKVEPDAEGLRDRLKKVVESSGRNVSFTQKVKIDNTGLRKRLQGVVDRASTGVRTQVGVDLDAKTLPAKARAARTTAQRAAGSVKIPVEFDVKKAAAGLAGVSRLLIFPVIAAAIGPLIGLVSALGGGLFALAAAIAPVVQLGGALPGVLALVGQGFAAVKIATSGLGDAFKQVSSAQEKLLSGQKLTQDELGKLQASLRNLAPAARTFVGEIVAIRPAFTQLRRAVQQSFFAPFVGQVRPLAEKYLPLLRREMTTTAGAIGRGLSGVASVLTSGTGFARVQTVMEGSRRNITVLSSALGPLVRLLVNLATASQGVVSQLVNFTASLIKDGSAASDAAVSSGRLAAAFERGFVVAQKLGQILVNVASGLFGLGKAATPLGTDLLDTLVRLTAQFSRFANSITGQDKARAYFESLRPALTEIGRLVGALATGIFQLGNNADLAPLLAQLRTQLGPALQNLLISLQSGLGPALINAATAFADLFAALAGGGGGGLTAFVVTITKFVEILTTLINTVPGASTALTAFFVAAGTVRAVTGIAGIVGGAGKAIFDFGSAAAGAVKNTRAFVTGFRQVQSGTSAFASSAQVAGAATRQNFAAAMTIAADSASKLRAGVISGAAKLGELGSAALTAAKSSRLAAAATKVWAGVQAVFNIIMAANPLVLIGLAVLALVAAVIIAYRESDRFRAIVQAAWAGIKAATTAAINFLRPFVITAFQAISAYLQVWFGVARAIFGALMAVFRAVGVALAPLAAVFRAYFGLISAIVQLAWQVIRLIFYVGLVGIVLLARYYWGILRAEVSTAWNAIKAVISAVVGAISATVRAVLTVLQIVWAGVWSAMRAAASTAMSAVRAVVSAGMSAVRAVVSAVTGAISAVWRSFWGSTLGGAVRSGVAAVLGAVRAVAGIVGVAASAAAGFARAIGSGIAGAVTSVARTVGSMISAVAGAAGRFYNAGTEIIASLIRGITSRIEGMVSAVSGAVDRVKRLLPGSPVKDGPLRVLNNGYAGGQIAKMIADGIQGRAPLVRSAAQQVANLINSTLGQRLGSKNMAALAGQSLGGFITRLKQAVPATATALNAVLKRLTPKAEKTTIGGSRLSANSKKLLAAAQAEVTIYQKIKGSRDAVVRALAAANEKLKAVQEQYAGIVSSVTENILTGASIVGRASADTAIQALTTRLQQAKQFTADIANLAKRGLRKDLLEQLIQGGVDQAGATASALTNATAAQLAQINSLQGQLVTAAGTAAKQSADLLYGAGVRAAQGLVNGLKAREAELTGQMQRIANLMAATIKKALGIRSPSRVFARIGDNVGAGLVNGLTGRTRDVMTAVGDYVSALGLQSVTPTLAGSALLTADRATAARLTPARTGPAPAPQITVYGAPGQSEEEIAAAVARRLGRAMR